MERTGSWLRQATTLSRPACRNPRLPARTRAWSAIPAVLVVLLVMAAFVLLPAPLAAVRAGGRPAPVVLGGVSYENLTLFPVLANGQADTSGFLTLDQALNSGDVVIREMGDAILRRNRDGRPVGGGGDEVNRLVLINRGRKPVLLVAGELVSGGKQDRVIAKDRIVAPGGEPLPLDVFCVEHGRWTAGVSQFNASKVIVHPSVREQAVVVQKQAEVWASVRAGTTAAPAAGDRAMYAAPVISAEAISGVMATAAPTESYAKVYRESRVGRSVDAFAVEIERRFRQALGSGKEGRLVGVVVAYGGEIAWSDVFASNALLDQYWPKLLRSYVTEALARPGTHEHAELDAARAFIEPLRGREQVESEPGVYRWRQVTAGSHVEIALQALPSGLDLHTVNIRRTGM